jgi:hypothetical protein
MEHPSGRSLTAAIWSEVSGSVQALPAPVAPARAILWNTVYQSGYPLCLHARVEQHRAGATGAVPDKPATGAPCSRAGSNTVAVSGLAFVASFAPWRDAGERKTRADGSGRDFPAHGPGFIVDPGP